MPSTAGEVELHRPEKVLFPDVGATKADLAAHFDRVADRLLPHLRDRPLMLHRFPDGIEGFAFYQKDLPASAPEWLERAGLPKHGGTVTHLLANDRATLQWLADQAAVVLHGWLSRADRPEQPDRVILDLDPTVEDFAVLRDGARTLRAVLRDLGLVPYLMTTGSRGLHVAVPIERGPTFDDTRAFALAVASVLVAHDDRFTVEVRKKARGDRVFVDTLRNGYAQTAVVPYSPRAKPGAPVATPIEWDELGRTDARRWTIANLPRRLARRPDDPWADLESNAKPLPAPPS
jgi:bifunctional non-homologous end joining protein LigD